MSQKAQEDWSVERVDATTLELSDAWPIYSVAALGYGASHAILYYDPSGSELNVQYYFKAFPLMTLWIPISIDAEQGFFGMALKPTMRDQINKIVSWGGGSITSRRSGSLSEPFPPRTDPNTTASSSPGK